MNELTHDGADHRHLALAARSQPLKNFTSLNPSDSFLRDQVNNVISPRLFAMRKSCSLLYIRSILLESLNIKRFKLKIVTLGWQCSAVRQRHLRCNVLY